MARALFPIGEQLATGRNLCALCHVEPKPSGSVSECHGCHEASQEALRPIAQRPAAQEQPSKKQRTDPKTTRMVVVPGGFFLMGYDHRHPDERPQHQATVSTFAIDLYEVTNEQYKQFVEETRRTPPDGWKNGKFLPAKANHPVAFVTWHDAHDYCQWAGKRLPTETEWERAARSDDGRLYPWGNDFDPKKANTPQSNLGDTTPVGSFPSGRSPDGLYDMGGNVWEWTDSWAKAYPGSPIPKGHYFTGEYKVLRGGSWVDCSFYRCGISSLTFNRGYFKPVTKNKGFGFRCAKDVTE